MFSMDAEIWYLSDNKITALFNKKRAARAINKKDNFLMVRYV